MNTIIKIADASSSSARSDLSSRQLPSSVDCSPFLNWEYNRKAPDSEKAVVFQSLVDTLEYQSAFDEYLEAKAVEFLESMYWFGEDSADTFLTNFESLTHESLTNLMQFIKVPLSTPMQTITIATMQMLETLVSCCSAKGRLALAEADLIHQLEVILNPLSLSFTETVDIHTHLMKIITNCFWILTPDGLKKLGIEEGHGEQAVSETVLKQVLIPSKTYICNLCMNRYSIVDRVLSMRFLTNLAQLIQICPYYQPLTQIVLDMPVFLTIPSCLTFFEKIDSIWLFLYSMVEIQQEWNKTRGAKRQMWTNVHRTLRMEGFADAMEAKLQYDRYTITGSYIGYSLIEWSILQGMNPPKYQ